MMKLFLLLASAIAAQAFVPSAHRAVVPVRQIVEPTVR
jgi:hypothetical protein